MENISAMLYISITSTREVWGNGLWRLKVLRWHSFREAHLRLGTFHKVSSLYWGCYDLARWSKPARVCDGMEEGEKGTNIVSSILTHIRCKKSRSHAEVDTFRLTPNVSATMQQVLRLTFTCIIL